MTYFKIQSGAVVTVRSYKNLLEVIRRTHANGEDIYIREFVYAGEKPLTEFQWLRIPRYARAKVARPGGFGDSVDFLEGLYALEDARA